MAFSEKFEDVMMVVAEKVGDNVYLSAIKDAFTAFMPFVIVGSMGTLLKTLVSSTTTGLAQWVPALAGLEPAFTAINYCTMSFMTVPITFLIGLYLARAKKAPEYPTALVSVAAYISMICTSIKVDGAGTALEAPVSGLLTTQMGAQGLFVGMLTAVVFGSLFCWLSKIDKIKIKMPPRFLLVFLSPLTL